MAHFNGNGNTSKKKYDDLSKQELIARIHLLEKKQKTKYGLVWEDKLEDVVEQCRQELPYIKEITSKAIDSDSDKPVNLLIEGDNYHALSVLNYTHKGKIDVIYIDPPYNTGNKDFCFDDRYVDKEDSFRHSKWLSFMGKRLILAKNLLRKSGVIFISIDDNEFAQLKMLCDSIFGETNFVDCISWDKKSSPKGVPPKNMIVNVHEYILAYQISDKFSFIGEKRTSDGFANPDNDPRGEWRNTNIKSTVKGKSLAFTIEDPETGNKYTDTWAFSEMKLKQLIANKSIIFPKNNEGQVRRKEFYNEFKNPNIPIKSSWGLFDNQKNTEMLKKILSEDVSFLNPKPIDLIIYLLKASSKKDSLVLDFFAGSGTTGHAVAALNKTDNGNRKFILCTNNENDIAQEICYPRIKSIIKGNPKTIHGEGIPLNLKYYKTAFVSAETTDENKIKLTDNAGDMLCIREDTYEEVKITKHYRIYCNKKKYTGIIYRAQAIESFKKTIASINGKFTVYVFSLDDEIHEEEFADIGSKVTQKPIPEAILRVYRRIFYKKGI